MDGNIRVPYYKGDKYLYTDILMLPLGGLDAGEKATITSLVSSKDMKGYDTVVFEASKLRKR